MFTATTGVIILSILIILCLSEIITSVKDEKNSAIQRAIHRNSHNSNKVGFSDIIEHGRKFNISSDDLIVLLHIQKTGGTSFEKHLVSDLWLEKSCSCNNENRRCNCPRPNVSESHRKKFTQSTWLMSRFSTGWICGLHPDWTALSGCLSRLDRLYFVTFLRNPIERFVSEFRHVQRGATWKLSKSHCKTLNTKLCYGTKESWSNVTIEEFMDCPTNMAINRQTWMLADLDLTQCPNNLEYLSSPAFGTALLLSAMNNLRKMAYIGICEEQRASQIMFEDTFGLRFKHNFEQSEDNKTKTMIEQFPEHIKQKIIMLNHLDMDLYRFALDLFWKRHQQLRASNQSNGYPTNKLKIVLN